MATHKEHATELLKAVARLEQRGVPDGKRTGPIMVELKAALPSMNEREFKVTMTNLRRRRTVRICNEIKMPHASRPVAVYALQNDDAPKTMREWRAGVVAIVG